VLDSRIFISYRHADSSAYAGRLYDRLKDRYGDERIFRDLEMDVGIDFVERIDDTVGSCAAMVVVIGPGWLDARDAAGDRRLEDPDDYVRVEISGALRRSIRVIPVLVGEATMPGKNELPDVLRGLARRNALELSDSRWDYDVGRLMEAVDRALREREEQVGAQAAAVEEPSPPVVAEPVPHPPRLRPDRERTVRPSPLRPALIAVAAAALAAVPAYLVARYVVFDHLAPSGKSDLVLRRALYQAAYWALVVGAVAVCVAVATRRRPPARALLTGLVAGAVLGGLSGALHQLLRNQAHHPRDFLVALAVLGAALGGSGVTGAGGLAAAAGGLVGGALAGLVAWHIHTGTFVQLLVAAVFIVAGVWTAELLRLRNALPGDREARPVPLGRGSRLEAPGGERD
jgi:hypothetical protein